MSSYRSDARLARSGKETAPPISTQRIPGMDETSLLSDLKRSM
jgi:hypothetical protein